MGLAFTGTNASAEPVLPPQPTPAPAPFPLPPDATVTPGPVGNTKPGTTPSQLLPPLPGSATPQPGAVPAQPTPVPASAGPLRDYFQSENVKLEPQQRQGFSALDITVPMPPRWTAVPDPNVPDAFAVIADRSGTSLYTSNAQVVVYELIGDFDPREAITHGYVDSRQLPAWQTTNASLADFGGFPSSIIEGTYRQNGMALNTSRRHVIATSGPNRYLVSLAVTTTVSRAVADAPGTEAIVSGFRVSAPKSTMPTAAPTPGPPALPGPGLAPAAQR
jgi:hypothetical protein